jgi:hypothetical protein
MSARQVKAVAVIQDVRTGPVIAFAASHPSELDIATPVYPLSLSKLLLCASWWDHQQPESIFDNVKGTANAQSGYGLGVSIHEMLVSGSDSTGEQMAVALRKSVGTTVMLEDFKRYGFGQRTDLRRDNTFWGEVASIWETRLTPAPAYVSLNDQTSDTDWGRNAFHRRNEHESNGSAHFSFSPSRWK